MASQCLTRHSSRINKLLVTAIVFHRLCASSDETPQVRHDSLPHPTPGLRPPEKPPDTAYISPHYIGFTAGGGKREVSYRSVSRGTGTGSENHYLWADCATCGGFSDFCGYRYQNVRDRFDQMRSLSEKGEEVILGTLMFVLRLF